MVYAGEMDKKWNERDLGCLFSFRKLVNSRLSLFK